MVIPSFGDFAPGPDLAGSYLGGVASAQHAQQIMQESQRANVALQMQQQRLQQESEQAAMANQIKSQQLQEEHLKNQQELAIKSQYEQTLNELKRDQIDQAGQLVKLKTQEAARKFSAQQMFQSRVSNGEDPNDVMREMAPMMGVTGAGMASLFRPQPPALGSKIAGPDGMSMVVTGNNQAQPYLPPGLSQSQPAGNPDEEGEDMGVPETSTGTNGPQIPMTAAMTQAATASQGVTQRGVQAAASLAQRKAEADKREKLSLVQRLQEQNQKDYDGSGYYGKMAKGDKLTPEQEKMAKRYSNRLDAIDRLNSELSGGAMGNSPSVQQGELGPGEAIHTLKNGRKAVFKDKEFVRYAD